jgi:hypothetical protein
MIDVTCTTNAQNIRTSTSFASVKTVVTVVGLSWQILCICGSLHSQMSHCLKMGNEQTFQARIKFLVKVPNIQWTIFHEHVQWYLINVLNSVRMSHLCHSLGKLKRPQVRLPVELPHITRQSLKTQDNEDGRWIHGSKPQQYSNSNLAFHKHQKFTRYLTRYHTVPCLPAVSWSFSSASKCSAKAFATLFSASSTSFFVFQTMDLVQSSKKNRLILTKRNNSNFNLFEFFNPVQPINPQLRESSIQCGWIVPPWLVQWHPRPATRGFPQKFP